MSSGKYQNDQAQKSVTMGILRRMGMGAPLTESHHQGDAPGLQEAYFGLPRNAVAQAVKNDKRAKGKSGKTVDVSKILRVSKGKKDISDKELIKTVGNIMAQGHTVLMDKGGSSKKPVMGHYDEKSGKFVVGSKKFDSGDAAAKHLATSSVTEGEELEESEWRSAAVLLGESYEALVVEDDDDDDDCDDDDDDEVLDEAGKRKGWSFAGKGAPKRKTYNKGTGQQKAKWRRDGRKNKSKRKRNAKIRQRKPAFKRRMAKKKAWKKIHSSEIMNETAREIAAHLGEREVASESEVVIESPYITTLEKCAVAAEMMAPHAESDDVFEDILDFMEGCWNFAGMAQQGELEEDELAERAHAAASILADMYGVFEEEILGEGVFQEARRQPSGEGTIPVEPLNTLPKRVEKALKGQSFMRSARSFDVSLNTGMKSLLHIKVRPREIIPAAIQKSFKKMIDQLADEMEDRFNAYDDFLYLGIDPGARSGKVDIKAFFDADAIGGESDGALDFLRGEVPRLMRGAEPTWDDFRLATFSTVELLKKLDPKLMKGLEDFVGEHLPAKRIEWSVYPQNSFMLDVYT
jgi:hypothetical protein